MSSTSALFWDDNQMLRRRLKEIHSLLDDLDIEKRPISPKISEELFLMPTIERNFNSEDEIENFYREKPEAFFEGERCYGIRSIGPEIQLGTGREIYVFSRKSILDNTIYNDYFTQCILLILYDWSREQARKSQNNDDPDFD